MKITIYKFQPQKGIISAETIRGKGSQECVSVFSKKRPDIDSKGTA